MSHPPEGISLYPQTGIIFQFYFDGYVMEFVPFRVFFSYTKKSQTNPFKNITIAIK